jgi:hypothetical protein
MAMRVASNNEGNGMGNKGGRQVTATRAIAVGMTAVSKDEGGGNGIEGGGRQRG